MPTIESVFRVNAGPQSAFWSCEARVIGYGGAMGGGKSRAICEKALDYALEYPGVPIVIARQKHTSITETTKKTMMQYVLPQELIARKKESGGEDFVTLKNGSIIHFIGLDDPVRWFSSEIGVFIVDQVEECELETIVKLITRVRHPQAPKGYNPNTAGYGDEAGKETSGKVILSFNPENPGHWLQRWFWEGSNPTKYGRRKEELFMSKDASAPIGDCEFFFAKATDNPHLPPGYVKQTLAALPEHLRRRYLLGAWEFISGTCYFDGDALEYYNEQSSDPWRVARTERVSGVTRLVSDKSGPWHIWEAPTPGHRYVAAVDVSSGGSTDYSAIQVVCVETFSQVAEFQAKLDPDVVAQEAAKIGWIYNDALVAPEITGGWGHSIVRELERIGYRKIHTRRMYDRIAKKWTDRLGWDTNTSTRAPMLDTLERVLREREFGLKSQRTLMEMGSFIRDERDRPAAQPGMNDDLVIALAIAVEITLQRPRKLILPRREKYTPSVSSVTGY